jgi:hypothetical protein
MKRPRKAATPGAAIAKELFDAARGKLETDYIGFVQDTATEDPKRFIARNAAARDALEHLVQLATHSGALDPVEGPGDHTIQQLIEAARRGVADENKT